MKAFVISGTTMDEVSSALDAAVKVERQIALPGNGICWRLEKWCRHCTCFFRPGASTCMGQASVTNCSTALHPMPGAGPRYTVVLPARSPHFIPRGPSLLFSMKTRRYPTGSASWLLTEKKISVEGISANEWRGIGTHKTITRSKGNILYSIDNIPALDIIERDLKIDGHPDLACEYGLLWEEEEAPRSCGPLWRSKKINPLSIPAAFPQGPGFASAFPRDLKSQTILCPVSTPSKL